MATAIFFDHVEPSSDAKFMPFETFPVLKEIGEPGYSSHRVPVKEHLGVFGGEQLESLRVVLNHISEAVFVLDEHGLIQMINPFGEQLFGQERAQITGHFWTDFLAQPFAAEYSNLLMEWTDTRSTDMMFSHGPREILVQRPDGRLVEVDLSLSCIPADRRVYIGVMHDVSGHKKEHSELRRLSRTDYLTQLANRRAFDEVMQRSWLDARERKEALSVLMIDIDHFKKYNDEFGHLQGDFVLRHVASAIQSALPSPRMVAARYGGEEFAVILSGCNTEQAHAIAEKIRASVAEYRFTHAGITPAIRMTVSIGVAGNQHASAASAISMVGAADTALYRAKLSGRNKVVMAGH